VAKSFVVVVVVVVVAKERGIYNSQCSAFN